MSGCWSQPSVPHKGWVDLGVHDEEEPERVCEMCEVAHVRFVHIMRHSDYPEDLLVGCVCAEKMSEDKVTPKAREKTARNLKVRREKWLSRSWRVSGKGNDYLRHQGVVFTIFQRRGAWNYCAAESGTDGRFGPGGFRSSDEAKLGVFDELWPPFRVPPRPR